MSADLHLQPEHFEIPTPGRMPPPPGVIIPNPGKPGRIPPGPFPIPGRKPFDVPVQIPDRGPRRPTRTPQDEPSQERPPFIN